jgi:hypothetical protein
MHFEATEDRVLVGFVHLLIENTLEQKKKGFITMEKIPITFEHHRKKFSGLLKGADSECSPCSNVQP